MTEAPHRAFGGNGLLIRLGEPGEQAVHFLEGEYGDDTQHVRWSRYGIGAYRNDTVNGGMSHVRQCLLCANANTDDLSAPSIGVIMKLTMKSITFNICKLCIIALLLLFALYSKQIIDMASLPLVTNNGLYIGEIHERQNIKHKFVLHNLTFKSMKIVFVEASCSCSFVKVDKYSIPPFGKSLITVNVDINKIPEHELVHKGVTIIFANGRKIDNLTFSFIYNPISNSGTPSAVPGNY